MMFNNSSLYASTKNGAVSTLIVQADDLNANLPLTTHVVKDLNDAIAAINSAISVEKDDNTAITRDEFADLCTSRVSMPYRGYLNVPDSQVDKILRTISNGMSKYASVDPSFATMLFYRTDCETPYSLETLNETFKKNARQIYYPDTSVAKDVKEKERSGRYDYILNYYDVKGVIPDYVITLLDSTLAYVKLALRTVGDVSEFKCITGDVSYTVVLQLSQFDCTDTENAKKILFINRRINDVINMVQQTITKMGIYEKIEKY